MSQVSKQNFQKFYPVLKLFSFFQFNFSQEIESNDIHIYTFVSQVKNDLISHPFFLVTPCLRGRVESQKSLLRKTDPPKDVS